MKSNMTVLISSLKLLDHVWQFPLPLVKHHTSTPYEEGEERPLLYLSCKFEPRETRYSTIEKEGLAIKGALESLHYYLLGREFDLETDHRALSWINTMNRMDRNARITR